MQFQKIPTMVATLALLVCPYWTRSSYAQSSDSQAKPDNTKVNQRDKDPGEATADQQGMNAEDRALTAKVRRSVIADKNLSTDAHNIKIISQNGAVTLKGPVTSDDEKKAIVAKAVAIVGSADKVTDQMSVKQ